MKKGILIWILVVIVLAVGGYQLTTMPEPLTDSLSGSHYTGGDPAQRVFSMDLGENRFHFFNQEQDIYASGTCEKLENGSYLLKGTHIPTQAVMMQDKKWTFLFEDQVLQMEKFSNTPCGANHSLMLAELNERKTPAQFAKTRNLMEEWDFAGEYGVMDADGNISTTPYRLVLGGVDFTLYQGDTVLKTGRWKVSGGGTLKFSAEDGEGILVYTQKGSFFFQVDGREQLFARIKTEAE